MREILFRGMPEKAEDYYCFSKNWPESCSGGFVYGSLVIIRDKYYICVSGVCNINTYINNGITSMIRIIPETASEFTGLLDKNNKKVFEGDIVNVNVEDGNYKGRHLVVRFDEYHRFVASGNLEYLLIPHYDWEVVGNVWEVSESQKD